MLSLEPLYKKYYYSIIDSSIEEREFRFQVPVTVTFLFCKQNEKIVSALVEKDRLLIWQPKIKAFNTVQS